MVRVKEKRVSEGPAEQLPPKMLSINVGWPCGGTGEKEALGSLKMWVFIQISEFLY